MGYNNNPIDTIIEECNNPEKLSCKNEAKRTHRLIDKNDNEKEYHMCNECYETWIIE